LLGVDVAAIVEVSQEGEAFHADQEFSELYTTGHDAGAYPARRFYPTGVESLVRRVFHARYTTTIATVTIAPLAPRSPPRIANKRANQRPMSERRVTERMAQAMAIRMPTRPYTALKRTEGALTSGSRHGAE
jgi:hypothetical protein